MVIAASGGLRFGRVYMRAAGRRAFRVATGPPLLDRARAPRAPCSSARRRRAPLGQPATADSARSLRGARRRDGLRAARARAAAMARSGLRARAPRYARGAPSAAQRDAEPAALAPASPSRRMLEASTPTAIAAGRWSARPCGWSTTTRRVQCGTRSVPLAGRPQPPRNHRRPRLFRRRRVRASSRPAWPQLPTVVPRCARERPSPWPTRACRARAACGTPSSAVARARRLLNPPPRWRPPWFVDCQPARPRVPRISRLVSARRHAYCVASRDRAFIHSRAYK